MASLLSRSERCRLERAQAALISATSELPGLVQRVARLERQVIFEGEQLSLARARSAEVRRENRELRRKLWGTRLGATALSLRRLLAAGLAGGAYAAMALGAAALGVLLGLYLERSPVLTRLGLEMPADFHARSKAWAPSRR